jgi:hypothetical protein
MAASDFPATCASCRGSKYNTALRGDYDSHQISKVCFAAAFQNLFWTPEKTPRFHGSDNDTNPCVWDECKKIINNFYNTCMSKNSNNKTLILLLAVCLFTSHMRRRSCVSAREFTKCFELNEILTKFCFATFRSHPCFRSRGCST